MWWRLVWIDWDWIDKIPSSVDIKETHISLIVEDYRHSIHDWHWHCDRVCSWSYWKTRLNLPQKARTSTKRRESSNSKYLRAQPTSIESRPTINTPPPTKGLVSGLIHHGGTSENHKNNYHSRCSIASLTNCPTTKDLPSGKSRIQTPSLFRLPVVLGHPMILLLFHVQSLKERMCDRAWRKTVSYLACMA